MQKLLTILVLTNLLTANIHGMQSLTMKLIFDYAMRSEVDALDTDHTQKISGSCTTIKIPKENKCIRLWRAINCFSQLQYVSKDFKRIFWSCFSSEEKNEFIAALLRMWNQGMYHTQYLNCSPMPPIADIAVSMQADLYPVLRHSIIVTNRKCNPEFVQVVVDAHDSNAINYQNSYGYTPLCYAIAYADWSKDSDYGHLKIIKLLLTYPDIQVNPVPKANPLPRQEKPKCALYWAVYHNHIDIVELLLAHPGIQVNALDGYGQQETALFAAVQTSSDIDLFRSMINLLIAAGIDETITNKDGHTALDVARQCTHTAEKAKVLEEALAIKNNNPPSH